MTRPIAILAFVAFLGGAVALADSSPPTTAQEKAWLQSRQAEFANDITNWEAQREALDVNEIRPLRHDFRTRTQACIDQTTLAAMRSCVTDLQTYLAAPGPAPSVVKHLHTITRQFGSSAKQIMQRHLDEVTSRLSLFP